MATIRLYVSLPITVTIWETTVLGRREFFRRIVSNSFLLSWPARLAADVRRDDLVSLTDLFAIATGKRGGDVILRDGCDVLGVVEGNASAREALFGMCGSPSAPASR